MTNLRTLLASWLAFFSLLLSAAAQITAPNYSFTTLTQAGEPFDYGFPGAIAADAQGNVYLPRREAHSIVRVAPDGTVTVLAGAGSSGPGYADGPAASARFSSPSGVARDPAGNLYVSDSGNSVIRKITPQGVVSTIAGRAGESGGLDGPALQATFGSLGSLAVDAAGNIHVLEFGFAVRKITAGGQVSTLVRSSGFTEQEAGFFSSAFAVDAAGNIFLADSGGNTIRKITPAGGMTIFAGTPGKRGSRDGQGGAAEFARPVGIAALPNGGFIVTDTDNGTLRHITNDGTVTTIAGQPASERMVRDGIGGEARFFSPATIAADASGNVYFVESPGLVVRKGVPTTAPAPPIITLAPATETGTREVGARAAVSFSAAATGSAPLAFQWLRNGLPIPGATSPTFTIASAADTDQGSYAVRVANAAGAVTSRSVLLRVFTPAFEAFTPRRTVAGGSFLWGIASGAGQLVAVGTGGKILSSSDGRTWTPRESGTSVWLVGVTYASGRFVAVGDQGVILISSDGVTWTRAASSGTTERLNNVAHGAGYFVAVGEAGTIVISADAQTWTRENSGVTTWLRGVVYVPSYSESPYVSGDNGTGRFYVAGQDGVLLQGGRGNWQSVRISAPAEAGRDIETLAEGPIGIGQDGTIAAMASYTLYSRFPVRLPDGSWGRMGFTYHSWSRGNTGLTARFRGLARGAGAVFATGENGIIAAAQSLSGPWSFIPTGTSANLVNGVFHGNSLYVVGENETILQSQPLYPTRLINIATRGQVSPARPMISGFVVDGAAKKTVLLRAAGPALANFGLTGLLPAPTLTLFDGASRPLVTNRGWSTAANAAAIAETAARVGAFPFLPGSSDSALLVTLEPGAYTAQVSGGDASGLVLIEAYDADTLAAEGSRAINISTRGEVGAGADRLIAGFVINGAAARRVLIRAVGPSLAQFGLAGLLGEPQIELYDQRGNLLRRAGAWSNQAGTDEIQAASVIAGAFTLEADSKDAALVTTLLPGSYTVQVSGANNTTGLAIVEVYDLP